MPRFWRLKRPRIGCDDRYDRRGRPLYRRRDAGFDRAQTLRVSLSDLAAIGADPVAHANVALPHGTGDNWLEAFAGGLRADQDAFRIHLAGGDSVSTPGAAVLTATLFGSVPAGMAVRRSGASPGDLVLSAAQWAWRLDRGSANALSADKSDIDT